MFKSLFRKSFIKISFVGVGTVLNASLGFLFLSSVAKTLPIAEFGKYALLISLLVSLSKLLDFGTNSLYVSEFITKKDKNLTHYFLSNKLIQLLITLPTSILILYIFKLNSWEILVTFTLGILFYGVYYSLFGLFQEKENYLMLVLLSTVPALIKGLGALLILTNMISLDFSGYFAIFSLSIGSSLLFCFWTPEFRHKLKLDFSKTKQTLKLALSPGVSQLIIEGFPAVSNTIAKTSFGFANVGIFSIADKISSAFVLVSFSIFTVLLPKNAARKRDAKGYDFQEAVILSVGVLLLSSVAILAARLFIPWFFENKYNESLGLLNMLVFSGALGSIHTFMENYFFVENKTGYLSLFSIGKLSYFIFFSAVFIPIFSLKGMALAHVTASFLTVLTIFYIVFTQEKKKA